MGIFLLLLFVWLFSCISCWFFCGFVVWLFVGCLLVFCGGGFVSVSV